MRLIIWIHSVEGPQIWIRLYVILKSLNATSRATILSSKTVAFYYFKIPTYSYCFLAQLLEEGSYGWKEVKFTVQKVRRYALALLYSVRLLSSTSFISGFHQIFFFMQDCISVHLCTVCVHEKKIRSTSEHFFLQGGERFSQKTRNADTHVLISSSFCNINAKL